MSAIPQITILVMACVIVLLISEMKCNRFITSRMEKRAFREHALMLEYLLPKQCVHVHVHSLILL